MTRLKSDLFCLLVNYYRVYWMIEMKLSGQIQTRR